MEIKCPYSPLSNRTLLPVSYSLPSYYACQVLTHMKVTDTNVLLFASCSKESVAFFFVDFQPMMWQSLYNCADELYGETNPTKPSEIQPMSLELKESIKEYSQRNSILIAEVPLVKTIDNQSLQNNPMVGENSKVFRTRKNIHYSTPDWISINSKIVDLCDETITLLEKCNNLLCRKATELLLFVATDTDQVFNKDLPVSVPIAYGMKGKSIRLDTAHNMINVIQNKLKEEKISVLVEALDGQWAGIVFRGEMKNPLTIYDFDKDCWLKFHQKSKINIINLMESYSHISPKHIEAFSKLNNVTPGHYHTGNIGITCTNEKRVIGKDQHIQKILYLYSFCGNIDMPCGLQNLRTPTLCNRPDLWGLDLGINGNMLALWDDKTIKYTEIVSNTDELPDLDDQGVEFAAQSGNV